MKFTFRLIEAKQDELNFRVRINNDDLVDEFLELKKKNIIKGADGDLSKYKNEDELKKVIKISKDAYENKASKRGRDILSPEIKNNTNYIYEDDKVQILQPLTFESSFYYGKATTWCISGRFKGNCAPNSGEWDNYTSKGFNFIFIIDKTLPKDIIIYKKANNKQEEDYHKYAICYRNGKIVNITDSKTDKDIKLMQTKYIIDNMSSKGKEKINELCNFYPGVFLSPSGITAKMIPVANCFQLDFNNLNSSQQEFFNNVLEEFQYDDYKYGLPKAKNAFTALELARFYKLRTSWELDYEEWKGHYRDLQELVNISNVSTSSLVFTVALKNYFRGLNCKEAIVEYINENDLFVEDLFSGFVWPIIKADAKNNDLYLTLKLASQDITSFKYITGSVQCLNNYAFNKPVRIINIE